MTKDTLIIELKLTEELLAEAAATHQHLIRIHRETIQELNAIEGSCTRCDGEGCSYCK